MFVIKFSLMGGGYCELYFKSAESAEAAFDAYSNTARVRKFHYIDDHNRKVAIPMSAIVACECFALADQFDAQAYIGQLRNDHQLREHQRLQQRASGLLVPANMVKGPLEGLQR